MPKAAAMVAKVQENSRGFFLGGMSITRVAQKLSQGFVEVEFHECIHATDALNFVASESWRALSVLPPLVGG